MVKFSGWIKDVRLNAGLTQREFAKRTKITYVSICFFESGKRVPAIQSVNKLAKFTNVSVKEIRDMIKYQQEKAV
jgi:transcriptional regulator with XRE-family HTH domain